jgi:hypothetical protein
MVEQLLQSNQQLCKRLKNLEDTFDARSTITKKFDNLSFISQADDATITTARPSANKRVSMFEAVRVHFAFDDDLQASRVYRMVKGDGCNHSSVSSAIRTQTWSIFSGLSLADISVISVVALPLYAEDIQGHSMYYTFGDPEPAQVSETTATWTSNQVLVETKQPPATTLPAVTEQQEVDSSSHDDTESIVSRTISHEDSLYASPSSASSVQAEGPQGDLEISQQLGITRSNSMSSERSPKLSGDLGDVEDQIDSSTALDAASDYESDDDPLDPDDIVYPCKGCGEILEDCKAFELSKLSGCIS